jgi:hypothetical protein
MGLSPLLRCSVSIPGEVCSFPSSDLVAADGAHEAGETAIFNTDEIVIDRIAGFLSAGRPAGSNRLATPGVTPSAISTATVMEQVNADTPAEPCQKRRAWS